VAGRQYSIAFENVAVTAASGDQDIFYLAPADDKPCRILAVYLSVISELGDAQEEWLRLQWIRGHATVGSGGAAVTTPTPLSPTDAAAGFTARTNDTTIASAGTAVVVHSDAFNVRSGWVYIPTPETVIQVTQTQTTLVLRLMAAVTDDVVMTGTCYIEELG
jgi:hypothetical protein